MITILIKKDILSIKNFIKENNSRKFIALFFILIILFFSILIYGVFLNFFSYLNTYTEVGRIISRVILGYSYFLVFILMIPSYLFSSILVFYFNKSLNIYVISNRYESELYNSLLLRSYLSGLWPVMIIALPIMIAYSSAFGVPISYILFVLFMFFPLSLLAYSLGILASFLFFKLKLLKSIIFWLILTCIFLYILPGLMSSLLPNELRNLYFAPDIKSLFIGSESLPILSNSLPSKWMTNITTQVDVFWSSILLMCWSVIIFFISSSLSKNTFINNWQLAQEGSYISYTNYHNNSLWNGKLLDRLNLDTTLIYRYLTSITRDNKAIISTLFLFLLAYISVILLYNVSGYRIQFPKYQNYLVVFSFVTINFIITIFSLKFIFPLVNFNIKDHLLVTSPITAEKITSSLMNYSTTLIFILAIIFTFPFLINNKELDTTQKLLYLISVIMTSITIAMINLIIGTSAANITHKADEDISSSIEGIISTIISVFFNILCAILIYKFSITTYSNTGSYSGVIIYAFIPLFSLIFLFMARNLIPQILRTKISI